MTIDAQQLADRYAAVWNEPDAAARREAIARLWVPDGVHHVKTRQARGHAELETRVAEAYDKNVGANGFAFRAVKNAQALREVVTFNWEMVQPATGQVLAVGLEFLHVDEEGRVVSDYQFIVA